MKTFKTYVESSEKLIKRTAKDGVVTWRLPNGQLHREDGPAIEDPDGTKYWYAHDQLHREDGPAAERPDGTKEWFIRDQRHREDGPAIEDPDGTKYWYAHDQLHREDGPAIEFHDGRKEWYLNDVEVFDMKTVPEDFQRIIRNQDMDTFVELLKMGKITLPEDKYLNRLVDIGVV